VETELSFEARTRRLEQVYEELAHERHGVNAVGGVPHHA
jgi:hypothetical protein